MRKSIALKTLLRSPVKSLLTFLLIAAASFALFSRVTDYAVTTREAEHAKSLYHAVASLDNEVQDIPMETKAVQSANGCVMTGYGIVYEMEDKPWPTKEELKEFASLPGATLADRRYMTAGLAEDYRRLMEGASELLFEGTYNGYIDDKDVSVIEDHVRLKFDDIKLIAGGEGLDIGSSLIMEDSPLGDMYYAKSSFTRAFYDSLEIGSRCLVFAYHSGIGGAGSGIYFCLEWGEDILRVIDGLPENYLETEDFARQKGWADAINYNYYAYDVVYTSDMRAIPAFNDQRLSIVQGRSVTAEDTDACVVSENLLKAHGLSIGDRIHVQLGDRLCHRNVQAIEGEDLPAFGEAAELSIVGAYYSQDADFAYSYSPNTIYVPTTLLPVEIPDDYEMKPQEFSVFAEKAGDIEAFYNAAEEFAQKTGLDLEFSDRGWLDVKESLGMGALASLFTTLLYITGAALASFLAVYLYIGRNKKQYAIMRMLGVSGKAAKNAVLLPFVAVAAFAAPIGGGIGLRYVQSQGAKSLAKMADSAPIGYVPDAALPIRAVILCLVLELLFVSLSAYFFLRKMKKVPPLELLQEGKVRTFADKKERAAAEAPTAIGFDAAKLSAVEMAGMQGNYGSIRHVFSYILRHMRRAAGKTAVSLALAMIMSAGIGTLALAKITYQDAFYELGVKGTASDLIFNSAVRLSTSPLVKDFYCYDNFGVRMEGEKENIPMTIASDLARALGEGSTVEYVEGYGFSSFEGTGQVCLVGKGLAEKLGISPGDEVGLLSGLLYSVLKEQGEEAVSNGYKDYKVIGIVDSEDTNIHGSIFTGIRNDLTRLFSIDFPVEHCEFTLADNDKLEELDSFLDKMRGSSVVYSQNVSYHLDSGGLVNIKRVSSLLESLFPIAVAAAVLLGLLGPMLVILQSSLEAAFLRILGVTKKRARCMLAFEQVSLGAAGILLVAGVLALYDLGRFAGNIGVFAACFGLYLLGYVCGTVAAAVYVTRHRGLELLQVKE